MLHALFAGILSRGILLLQNNALSKTGNRSHDEDNLKIIVNQWLANQAVGFYDNVIKKLFVR